VIIHNNLKPTCFILLSARIISQGGTMALSDLPTMSSDVIRIVCISDTHGDDPSLSIPQGDIFIHAGDMGGKNRGTPAEMKLAYDWIAALPHQVKVVVAGENFH
jgi:hypothetical protein